MPDLDRFLLAQQRVYDDALAEIRAGSKRSHWMWLIFPQIAGLGQSATSRHYAISGLAEAKAYLAHETLGPRLAECTGAMLKWRGKRTVGQILGPLDALKFASSMTLFEAAGGGASFTQAIEGLLDGRRDEASLALLGASG
jgi:uncharacterized protein (DUF1810 family)